MKRHLPLILVIVALGAALYGLTRPATAGVTEVGNAELSKLQADGVPIVDVRTPSEFSASHIPGSVNVPMDQLDAASATWNPNEPILLYCATGARSSNAAELLKARGFSKVYNLTAGIVAWDGPTENGAGQDAAQAPSTIDVETNGKPIFIDFAGSN